MDILPSIELKRDGGILSHEAIHDFVTGAAANSVPEVQLGAMLMAIFKSGMNLDEITYLTKSMRDSGSKLTFSKGKPVVDKHSTGGIGDKVSLPLAPLLAACGCRVPMISGRGLGITGGTLDKLEAIPGFRTALTEAEIHKQIDEIGCVICSQTANMVPADKTLYALRNASGTVPTIPLLVSSIMSKKLAEGLEHLVLDVKFGKAAFMTEYSKAKELAQTMVDLGNQCGVKTTALLTRMDVPIGRNAGNWLEIKETADYLEDFTQFPDLHELVIACAQKILKSTHNLDADAARTACEDRLRRKVASLHWVLMLEAQGADIALYRMMLAAGKANHSLDIFSPRDGYISDCNARTIGEVVKSIGGGRTIPTDEIDPMAGAGNMRKPGEYVKKGDVLVTLHGANAKLLQTFASKTLEAYTISDTVPQLLPLITEAL
jgi:pyrimidine-nucleoside phosphorylase